MNSTLRKSGPWWASGKRDGWPTPAPWRCPACETANIASARFCGGCGRVTSLAGALTVIKSNPRKKTTALPVPALSQSTTAISTSTNEYALTPTAEKTASPALISSPELNTGQVLQSTKSSKPLSLYSDNSKTFACTAPDSTQMAPDDESKTDSVVINTLLSASQTIATVPACEDSGKQIDTIITEECAAPPVCICQSKSDSDVAEVRSDTSSNQEPSFVVETTADNKSEFSRRNNMRRTEKISRADRSAARKPHVRQAPAHKAFILAGAGADLYRQFRARFGHGLGVSLLGLFFLFASALPVFMISGFGIKTVSLNAISHQSAGRILLWNDLRGPLSTRLGLTSAETDEMARLALGSRPSDDRPMTRTDARALAGWLGTIRGVPASLIPAPLGDGPLTLGDLYAASSGPGWVSFTDLPVDHPVYHAWSALLAAGISPATSDGAARPQEPILWEDWTRVCQKVAYMKFVQMPNADHIRRGPMSVDDATAALADAAACLGRPGNTVPRFTSPSRLEVFAALSTILERGEDSL
ncbi:MAG: zinc ribbon domain-containing protein [Candidatus Riflebacteria bacterium]|nr:zinc ribbon domain-containing protein [Candidatus Riflebacteria bacterium]